MKDKMKFNESCRCQEQNSESYKSVGKSHFHSSLACDLIPRTSVSKQNQSRTWSQQHKEPRRRHAKRQTTPLIPVYWQVGIHIPKLSLPFFLLLGKSRRNFPYGTQSLKGYMSWFCSPLHGFPIIKVMSALRACDGMGMCPWQQAAFLGQADRVVLRPTVRESTCSCAKHPSCPILTPGNPNAQVNDQG